jgi:hypothetical protein
MKSIFAKSPAPADAVTAVTRRYFVGIVVGILVLSFLVMPTVFSPRDAVAENVRASTEASDALHCRAWRRALPLLLGSRRVCVPDPLRTFLTARLLLQLRGATFPFPETFRISVISDPDKKSKAKDKAEWRAQYMTGTLRRTGESYSVTWDVPASVGTGMNEAGRGAELSELVRYNGGLYSFDDRTGIMFEILNPEDR